MQNDDSQAVYMRTNLLCAAIVCLFLATCAGMAQQPCSSTVLVTALDQNTNQPIDGLSANDFHAKLKGREIPIRAAAPPPTELRFVFVLESERKHDKGRRASGLELRSQSLDEADSGRCPFCGDKRAIRLRFLPLPANTPIKRNSCSQPRRLRQARKSWHGNLKTKGTNSEPRDRLQNRACQG